MTSLGRFNTTTKYYKKCMFQYGIMTIINVLEHYEREEEYEECKKIMDSIREQETRLGIRLSTRITDECLNEVIEAYKSHDLTGVNAIENSEYAAEKIIEEIESNKLKGINNG